MFIPEEMCSVLGQINAGSRLGPDFWAALIWSKALVGVYFCVLWPVYFCAERELFVAMFVYFSAEWNYTITCRWLDAVLRFAQIATIWVYSRIIGGSKPKDINGI